MLRATPRHDIRSIGTFLLASGYNRQELLEQLELSEAPFANGENLEPLLLKTSGDSVLAVLARLFFVGWPEEEARCSRAIPPDILASALACGLITPAKGKLGSTALLIPFQENLIACDNARVHGGSPDIVAVPSGSATRFLARLAIGGANETTLDVGSGGGVLAIEAAAYSRQVSGTDINARTLSFAAFSASLNGIDHAEFLCGDAFSPVAGRRFSRILANPPFFLSPAKKYTYCDSPLELDGFTGRLTSECPQYLEEGGFFQMISQWVDLEKEPWEQRLREWTATSGCDVLVLLAPRLKPISYAETRAKEARLSQTNAPQFDFAERVNYLLNRGVTSILSGVITMRKRSGGKNWFTILAIDPAGPRVGPGIRERFDTLTFLTTKTEPEVIGTRFRFASDVQLETIAEPGVSEWTSRSIELVKSEGLIDRLGLDAAVAGCLPLFDGQRTVGEVAEAVSERLGITRDAAKQRCLQLVHRMLQSSFLLPVDLCEAPTDSN